MDTTIDYGHNGYIGTWLCSDNGTFDPVPVVTLTFSQSYADPIPGVTIKWSNTYNEWATEYRITAYHGSRAIFNDTATNDGPISIMYGDISGFDRIEIEILKWSKPLRRARIEEIILGIERIYEKADLISYKSSMYVDPLSASLPKSEVSFEIKNLNGEYNFDNPASKQKYIMERQKVVVRYGYLLGDVIEWIDGGTYYLSEWETPQNGIKASFTARDALEYMTDNYNGPTNGTLYDVVEAALIQANLPGVFIGVTKKWEISDVLRNYTVPRTADAATSLLNSPISQVIQMCANAAKCVFYQDRQGLVRVEPINPDYADYVIGRFNSYNNAEVTLSKQLKAVDINNGEYKLTVGVKGETQPLSNFLVDQDNAPMVAAWIADHLQNRRTFSGSFRADPRLDPMDIIKNENKYATTTVLVTQVDLSYNGAFRGSFESRGLDNFDTYNYYSNEVFSGEI